MLFVVLLSWIPSSGLQSFIYLTLLINLLERFVESKPQLMVLSIYWVPVLKPAAGQAKSPLGLTRTLLWFSNPTGETTTPRLGEMEQIAYSRGLLTHPPSYTCTPGFHAARLASYLWIKFLFFIFCTSHFFVLTYTFFLPQNMNTFFCLPLLPLPSPPVFWESFPSSSDTLLIRFPSV